MRKLTVRRQRRPRCCREKWHTESDTSGDGDEAGNRPYPLRRQDK